VDQELGQPAALSVLLAEDNLVNQRVASALLTKIGHRVTICNNGAEAVQAVMDGEFDVILMDIQMPVMDGLTATAEIRALPDPKKAKIPILAISANVRESDIAIYHERGIDEVLSKPLRPDRLRNFLDNLPGDSEEPQDQPLIDEQQIAALREALAPDKLKALFSLARDSLAAASNELRQGWGQGDRKLVAAAAHRLAGVARNFGCLALGECAARIETAALAGDDGRSEEAALDRLLTASLQDLPH